MAIVHPTAHREYFNQKAGEWDSLLSEETIQCLSTIIKELAIKPGSHILDVGTGTGVLLPFLVEAAGKDGRVVALDIAEEMLARAKAKNIENVEYVLGDITCTPFEDNTFDEIICNSCFPHVIDKPQALREMARLLKPGGRLVICHPMSREAVNELHKSIGGVVGNDLLPDDQEMQNLCRQAGLEEVNIVNTHEKYVLTARKP
ncbi:MAG: methyltransferase domain-containing protein [Thermanaeromonas sp.]|uniref:class I SAM-dependent methyltransferase n=1 Tax=Thermanaeromonas sp. TaxID=2003697 RepID=UPI00243A6FB2|nr:methyltransferase domain-containing protein [Thermanaeromonas sp.]MCG0279063.1 methyltransferase domain-containing protein [Thermanaeromonas sp.]